MEPEQIFRKVKASGRNNLTEVEAREVLNEYKIPIAKAFLAKTVEQSVTYAENLGYPVVLKVVSPDVLHKTDVGGVVLNLKNSHEVVNSYTQILKNVRRHSKKTRINGILVQKMIESGQEVIIGGKKDLQFDQVIAFGLGGVFVEVFEDVSFRVVPIERRDAIEMIEEIKGYKVLKGFRGKTYDVGALVNFLLKTSQLLEENKEIKELDINPVIVSEKGAVAVDARIIVE